MPLTWTRFDGVSDTTSSFYERTVDSPWSIFSSHCALIAAYHISRFYMYRCVKLSPACARPGPVASHYPLRPILKPTRGSAHILRISHTLLGADNRLTCSCSAAHYRRPFPQSLPCPGSPHNLVSPLTPFPVLFPSLSLPPPTPHPVTFSWGWGGAGGG